MTIFLPKSIFPLKLPSMIRYQMEKFMLAPHTQEQPALSEQYCKREQATQQAMPVPTMDCSGGCASTKLSTC